MVLTLPDQMMDPKGPGFDSPTLRQIGLKIMLIS